LYFSLLFYLFIEVVKMALNRHRRAVGVFPNRQSTERALNELKNSGFPMDNVSVVARDTDKQDEIAGAGVRENVGNRADEGATTGAVAGGAVGGLTGLLVGLGALAIPGIGPVMLAGATATAIATALSGTAIGAAAGSLIGALVGLGIPEERARVYNERVSRGEYLVIVDGTEDEIRRAEAILNSQGIQEFGVYDAPGDRNDAIGRYDTPDVAAVPSTYGTAPVAGVPVRRHQRAIGVFPSRRDAQAALTELRDSGFPMDRVSVIGKDADTDDRIAGANVSDRVGNKADEGATAGAVGGGALGGLTGLLVGLGTVAIPGIGPVIAGGATATALATALTGGAIGAAAGGLGGALVGLGIPDERARVYNDRVSRGDYLVIVEGSEDEIRRAEAILNRRGIQEFGIYDAADDDPRTRPNYAATTTPGVGTTGTRTDYVADTTPIGTSGNEQVISEHPEVVIIDRRDETL
jgi:hypothetical protein